MKLEVGNILIIRSNGSVSIVGSVAVVDAPHERYAYAGYLVRVRLNANWYNPHFLKMVLSSQLVRGQIEEPIRTTSGVKNINSTEIGSLKMPSAPLNEQNCIVSKLN